MQSLLNRLLGRAKSHTMVPTRSTQGRQYPFLPNGKWVVTPTGAIGITVDTSDFQAAYVMLTDENGYDLQGLYLPVGQLRIATLLEIPEPRRPDPDRGAQLGYF